MLCEAMPERDQNKPMPGRTAHKAGRGEARAAREARSAEARAAREARSAEALRENLKRRKEQARQRSGEGGERHDDEGTGPGGGA
jgi:hypothetical protein